MLCDIANDSEPLELQKMSWEGVFDHIITTNASLLRPFLGKDNGTLLSHFNHLPNIT